MRMCPHRIGEQVDFHTADDPNDLWPQTTWQQDTSGTFPMASSPAHALGSTGGSETHMLSTSEIPSHSHGLNSHTHTYAKPNTPTGGTAITVDQMPSHTHAVPSINYEATVGSNSKVAGTTYHRNSATQASGSTGGGQAHTHAIGTTSTNTGEASGSTDTAGGGVFSQHPQSLHGRQPLEARRLAVRRVA